MKEHDQGPSELEQLISQNTSAAEIISSTEENIDTLGADFLMRNVAVLADRLTAADFEKLPKEVQDQMLAVTVVADDLAPLSEAEKERHPDESEFEYRYRTEVWQKVHNLQTFLHTGNFDQDDPQIQSKLKFVTRGAGDVFKSVLSETKDLPRIKETTRYFSGNTEAAKKRADKITATQNREAA